MPGSHPAEKVAFLSRLVEDRRGFEVPDVPREHVTVLEGAVDLGLVGEALMPWGAAGPVQSALLSRGVRVWKSESGDVRAPLAPPFYQSVTQQRSAVESVFLSVTGAPLDLAIPAAL
jgi:hypothetical protein